MSKNKKLSQKDVKHIARLANLNLSEAEVEKFRLQLSAILDYMEVISSIDTSNVSPTTQITGLKNISRGDIPQTSLNQEDAVATAPSKHNGFIKVKAIFYE